jgi:hypothetical protein
LIVAAQFAVARRLTFSILRGLKLRSADVLDEQLAGFGELLES